jgi:Protein of unknown function (DUF4239)
MNFYWVYDLPNWAFFLMCVTITVLFSLLGSMLFTKRLEKWLGLVPENNSIIGTFLSLSGVFYGVTLGLITVSCFENFNSTSDIVNNESSALAALYSDVSILNNTDKEIMQNTLKKYTAYVVNEAWPMQRIGEVPMGGNVLMDTFEKQFARYNPNNEKDVVIYEEVLRQFNVLTEKRRLRLNAINSNLPSIIWLILFTGAFVNIILTWLLISSNKRLDIVIHILSGTLLGSLIFLIAAMDNPFRGEYSVNADSFQFLLDGIMK